MINGYGNKVEWDVRLPLKQREAHLEDWRAVEVILSTGWDEYVQVWESVDDSRPTLIYEQGLQS